MSACRSLQSSTCEVIDYTMSILHGIKHLFSYSSAFCQSTCLFHILFQVGRNRPRERSLSIESQRLVLIRRRRFWTRTVFRQTKCLITQSAKSTRNKALEYLTLRQVPSLSATYARHNFTIRNTYKYPANHPHNLKCTSSRFKYCTYSSTYCHFLLPSTLPIRMCFYRHSVGITEASSLS
jgi:hypothetical protein